MKLFQNKFFRTIRPYLLPSVPISRRLYGLDVLYDSRDHGHALVRTGRALERYERIPEIYPKPAGTLWDIGANVGLHSLYWMKHGGSKAVAFELSHKAVQYIRQNASRNHLKVDVVDRAFSVEKVHYKMPVNAHPCNNITEMVTPEVGDVFGVAIPFWEAIQQFGAPDVIKMDIEGHEYVVLSDRNFLRWVSKHDIVLIVEFHGGVDSLAHLELFHILGRQYLVRPVTGGLSTNP